MRIEVMSDPHFNHGGRKYYKGDIVTVDDDLGRYFVETMGWAKDVEGKVKQAERQTSGEVRLFVESSKQGVTNG